MADNSREKLIEWPRMQTSIRQRWPEIRALFEAALTRPRATRESFVALQAASDPQLCSAVLALLRNEPEEEAHTLGEDYSPNAVSADGDAPARLGNYRLLRPLGRGGMGVVWLAEQAQPQRLVALKLIAGEAHAIALTRFKREASALALLAHPGIAQVYEAGAAEGRPFLAMEYVDGQPLTPAAAPLDRRARLSLLVRIADAVAHAHARGVIHRDLKPSNILVTADGHPKVLDFGIAALTCAAAEPLTATGTLLGTPSYMSPEQATGQAGNDPRIDVYALGVIGYELLCDRLPIAVAGMGPLEALRALAQQTPLPLSRIDASLRGDLETVIAKALAREPALRYANAGAFADDLRRFLDHEPVAARPPSRWRRLLLFGKRNPALLGLGLTSVLVLIVGALVSLWFALGQSRERERAESALAESHATLDALQRVFSAGNPVVAGQPEVSFRAVLNSAFEQLSSAPESVQASVGFALADALAGLGDNEAALLQFERVEQLAERTGDDGLRLHAGLRQADLLIEYQPPASSTAILDRLMRDPEAAEDPLVRVALLVLRARANNYFGRITSFKRDLTAAVALWPPPIAARDQRLAAEIEIQLLHGQMLAAEYMANDSRTLAALGPQANAMVARLTPILGAEHPWLIELRVHARSLAELGQQTAHWAVELSREVDTRMSELGPSHPAIVSRVSIGLWLDSTPDAPAHLSLVRQALKVIRALPLESRWRLRMAGWLARDQNTRGLEGMLTVDEFRAMESAHCGPDRPLDYDCVVLVDATMLRLQGDGRTEEAIAHVRGALRRETAGMEPLVRAYLLQSLTGILRESGQFDAAAEANDQVIAVMKMDTEQGPEERALRILGAIWNYRPNHCERALAELRPLLPILTQLSTVAPDVLARLQSTCEVRAGEDPARAIARMDEQWLAAQRLPADSAVRLEIVLGYLEIFDVLKDEARFRQWAGELQKLEQAGVRVSQLLTGLHPWVLKARAFYLPKPPDAP